jgi:hypothetical protein
MDAYGPEVERQMRRLFNSLGEKDEKKSGNGSPIPSLELPQMCYGVPPHDRVVICVDWTVPPDPNHHTINGY